MLKSIVPAAVLALAVSAPAQAEVVAQGNGSFVTRDRAVVSADLRETWLKLISPGEWWDDAHTWSGDAENMSITPQGGGCFCERIPADEKRDEVGLAGSVEHMTVIHASPDNVLRMRGGLGPLQSEPVDGVLTIALSESKEGTVIVFEYVVGGYMRFETPVIARAVDGVMSQQLSHLAELLGRVDEPKKPAEDKAEEAPEESESAEEEAEEDAPERESVDEAFGDIE